MSWFKSNTLSLSATLVFLPVLAVCITLFMPIAAFVLVLLYLIAWHSWYQMALTDAEFTLPYHPIKVFKINLVQLHAIVAWILYMPKVVSFLHWRYWNPGSDGFKKNIRYNVPYCENSKLDVYCPTKKQDDKPSKIIIFIYGGGWGSGSKFLYMTLANTLRELGYVVVVPDYRKYPQVKINEIYKEIRASIQWTFEHAKEIHGDPSQMYILSHSAGAHLAAQVVLSDVIEQVKINKNNQVEYGLQKNNFLPPVKGLILMAGVYDISSHYIFEANRGIEKLSAMGRVMGSTEEGYKANSPIRLIKKNASIFSESNQLLLDLFPRILFLHGYKDTTVGIQQTIDMFNTLNELFSIECRQKIDIRMRLHKRMTHGEPVTSLMLNYFSEDKVRSLLLGDIQEFMNE